MMSDKPKYLYFNFRGRGELPRLVCAAGGLQYDDIRINWAEWETEYKPKAPYHQVPCLILKDKWYAQKMAISIYFARQCGLYPKTNDEKKLLKMDHALYFVDDVFETLMKCYEEGKLRQNYQMKENVKANILPLRMPGLEKLLAENGTGYYVGDKLSIVDLDAFDFLEHIMDEYGPSYLDPYPHVKANFEKVGQHPGIKKYVANRPTPLEGFPF